MLRVRKSPLQAVSNLLDFALRGFSPGWLQCIFTERLSRYEMQELNESAATKGIPIVSGCFMLCRGKVNEKYPGLMRLFSYTSRISTARFVLVSGLQSNFYLRCAYNILAVTLRGRALITLDISYAPLGAFSKYISGDGSSAHESEYPAG